MHPQVLPPDFGQPFRGAPAAYPAALVALVLFVPPSCVCVCVCVCAYSLFCMSCIRGCARSKRLGGKMSVRTLMVEEDTKDASDIRECDEGRNSRSLRPCHVRPV